MKELYELGEAPPLGVVPPRMYAATLREPRFGVPRDAFQIEVLEVPKVGRTQVLVWVMAAGMNYNGVWAALGHPVNVIAARRRSGQTEDFHIAGSDAAGIVWNTGDGVSNVQVGDEVVLSCGTWDENAADIQAGADPITSSSARIWGYETNWGSFAQFALVEAYQCFPKPQQLSWAASACYMLTGATAWRMLHGYPPNTVGEDHPVLVWGGAGGLGAMAIQIVREAGGHAIAVVSDDAKRPFCMQLGARAVLNRGDSDHWGPLPNPDGPEFETWLAGAQAFGHRFWEAFGEKRNPKIVFEHPGLDTLPTSIFVCDNAGMVVICAGTSGFNADVDLRYLWMRSKRLQGSHFSSTRQILEFNGMVVDGRIEPPLTQVSDLHDVGEAHQLMYENRHPPGKTAILVNASDERCTIARSDPSCSDFPDGSIVMA